MMASTLSGFDGYESKTFTYKKVDSLDLKLDVLYPTAKSNSPLNVLVHIHGGFLVVGDRYSFVPYWLINAAVSRNWIFVTPDYRLIPETTAHSCVDDCLDAYAWVQSSLSKELDLQIGHIMLAGSSAGGYLALTTTTAMLSERKQLPPPSALLLIYGVLDATNERYTTDTSNIFNRPEIDTAPLLKRLEQEKGAAALTGYSPPADPTGDYRIGLMSVFHQENLYPDWMTGVAGLGRKMAEKGADAIPKEHRRLFAAAFGLESLDLPPTAFLHGKNDSAVPVVLSEIVSEKLKRVGKEVFVELPEDMEHGADVRAGRINVEKGEVDKPWAANLKRCVEFIDEVVGRNGSKGSKI